MKLVDLVDAAGAVLADVEHGRLADPDDWQRRAVERARSMFGQVIGPGDPLWELHGDVARQYIEAGGMTADELAEFAAVLRRREGRAGGAETSRVHNPEVLPE